MCVHKIVHLYILSINYVFKSFDHFIVLLLIFYCFGVFCFLGYSSRIFTEYVFSCYILFLYYFYKVFSFNMKCINHYRALTLLENCAGKHFLMLFPLYLNLNLFTYVLCFCLRTKVLL